MEVHHHPHPAGKRFKHYLFEFFMLFLAVFAGFLAENQREHFIERKKEKQFAKQLLTDIREDSAFFIKRIADLQACLQKHAYFFKIMTQSAPVNGKELINAGLPLLSIYDVQVTTSTYTEMKTSGSLRYIRNHDLTTSLQKYYDILIPRAVDYAAEANKYYNNNITPFLNRHFRAQDVDLFKDSVISKDPVIMNRTAETDQELLNIMEGYRFHHIIQIENMLNPALRKAKEIILQIEKEYSFE